DVSPQLARLERDAVERFGATPAPVRMRVGQKIDTVQYVNTPAVPARVAREARVARRLPVARDDGVARLESWRGILRARLGRAPAHHVHHARQQLRVLAVRQGSVRVLLEVPRPRLELLA